MRIRDVLGGPCLVLISRGCLMLILSPNIVTTQKHELLLLLLGRELCLARDLTQAAQGVQWEES